MKVWRVTALAAGAIAAVVLLVVGIIGGGEGGEFRRWLSEVRGDSADRGWDLLAAEPRAAYGGSVDDYLAEVSAVDWDAVRFGPAVEVWEDEGFVRIEAHVLSDAADFPTFLFDRRLVHAVCDELWRPVAIGAYEDRRFMVPGGFGGGGVTGSQKRCQDAFREAASGG